MLNLIFACLVSLVSGLSFSSLSSNNQVHVLEDREITNKQIMDYQGNHYLLSFTDYCSKAFVYHLLAEWDLWNLETWQSIDIGNLNGQVVLVDNLVMNSWGQSTLSSQFVRINITRHQDVTSAISPGTNGEKVMRFRQYQVYFYSAENSASLHFGFYLVYPQYTYNGVEWYNYNGDLMYIYAPSPNDKVILMYKTVANNSLYLDMLTFAAEEEVIVARQEGYNSGFAAGRQVGYEEFLDESNYNPEMLTIFTGIINVALLPVNFFLSIFNFEIFGINIAGFISSLLTVSIIIIILRLILGGKSNDK